MPLFPNLSRASYSWKKYPAFLTDEGQQFFLVLASFITEHSDKIRTVARDRIELPTRGDKRNDNK